MAQDFPSLAGQLLIAMPALNDPNFENTVTLICEHNESGAMGLTITRPMDLTHSDVFEQIAEYDEIPTTERNARKGREPVLKGGPVALERGPDGEFEETEGGHGAPLYVGLQYASATTNQTASTRTIPSRWASRAKRCWRWGCPSWALWRSPRL